MDVKKEVPPLQGIAVMRYPPGKCDGLDKSNQDIAKEILEAIHQGARLLALPNYRDAAGFYIWDFEIIGGPKDQVLTVRDEVDQPTIVEKMS